MNSLSVIRISDGWTIIAGGKRWGRFSYQVDAEEAALRLAARAADKGDAVEVLVQGPFGELRRLMQANAA